MDRSMSRVRSPRVSKGYYRRMPSLTVGLLTLFCGALLSELACNTGMRRSGVPANAQAVIDTSLEDIDAGRYDKLYHEAADEWRIAATLDESKVTLKTLRDKLGK